MKRRRGQLAPCGVYLMGEGGRVPIALLPFRVTERQLVTVDQQHVFHVSLLVLRLTSRGRADDEKRLCALRHCVWERCIRRLVREVLLAGKEANKRPAAECHVLADGSAQHGIAGLERVEHRALRGWLLHVELQLAIDSGQGAQMVRKYDPDHYSVWTSTESTGGRSRTIAAQLSPPFAEQ